MAAGAPSAVRVVPALLLFCLAPGAAVLSRLLPRPVPLELGLVLATSLSVVTVLGEAMLVLHFWHPALVADVLAVTCLALVGSQLRGSLEAAGALGTSSIRLAPHGAGGLLRLAFARSPQAATRGGVARPSGRAGLHSGFLGGAIVWWLLALHEANLHHLSGYGLLPALPVTYYGALVFLTLGFVLALSDRALTPRLLAAYVVVLVVVLHGTTAVLYPEPRYTWVYKHLGVIDYISKHGAVHRAIDIYHNWPGFFAANAWLERVSGLQALSYAPWAQVFFELANVAALLFVLRGLTNDLQVQWRAVWIFLIANWVGQDYLAPQAFGFFVVLVVFGLCIRCAPAARDDASGRLAVALRRAVDLLKGDAGGPPTAPQPDLVLPLSPVAATFIAGLGAIAVIVTHQLSPVMMVAGLFAFMLFTRRLGIWAVVPVLAAEFVWIALAYPYLNRHFSLFSFDLFPTARPKGETVSNALPGVDLVRRMSQLVVIAVVGLAITGIVRARRSGRFDLGALSFMIAPIVVVPVQSYGGEVLFRAYLFSLPWLAYFGAIACEPSSSARGIVSRAWRPLAATAVVGTGFLFSYFGLEKINYVTRADVAAATWYERHAPTGSVMAYATSNFPDRLTADYARHRIFGSDYVPQLTDVPSFRTHRLGSRDIPRLVGFLRGADAKHTYLVVSPSEENYARLYGIMSKGSLPNLVRALRRSTAFRLVFQQGQAFVFELLPEVASQGGRIPVSGTIALPPRRCSAGTPVSCSGRAVAT